MSEERVWEAASEASVPVPTDAGSCKRLNSRFAGGEAGGVGEFPR